IDEVCQYESGFRIAKPELYQHYQGWCDDHEIPENARLDPAVFGKCLIAIGGGRVTVGQKVETPDGRKDAYTGVRLRSLQTEYTVDSGIRGNGVAATGPSGPIPLGPSYSGAMSPVEVPIMTPAG